jgi:hypothetical protein
MSGKMMACVGALQSIPKATRDKLELADLTDVGKVGQAGFNACASLGIADKAGLMNTVRTLKVGGKRRKASSKKSSKSRKQRGGKCINGVDWEVRDAQGHPQMCAPPQNGGKCINGVDWEVRDAQGKPSICSPPQNGGKRRKASKKSSKKLLEGGKRRKASSKKSSKKARKH